MADSKHFEIPKASVRKIMKTNDEVSHISADAVSVTTKATEMFIADFAEVCMQIAVSNKRKTIKVMLGTYCSAYLNIFRFVVFVHHF
mmetsp:Transcript_54096/g.94321  ORF Transcript_54096/g.94321 Transcript_54096/m.94321 type:complete len:87 (-) Transcript_54096:1-261(-)